MYKYDGRDTHIDTWYKGLIWLSAYDMGAEGNGFTVTLLGNNFNFVRGN